MGDCSPFASKYPTGNKEAPGLGGVGQCGAARPGGALEFLCKRLTMHNPVQDLVVSGGGTWRNLHRLEWQQADGQEFTRWVG